MRKLFTLLASVLLTTGAFAQDATTIFHYQTNGESLTEAKTYTCTGGSVELGTTDNAYGDKLKPESAKYDSSVPADMKSTGSNGQKFGGNAAYAKLMLNTPLQAGDIIQVCGYLPIRVGSEISNTSTDIAASIATGSAKDSYKVGEATVPATAEGLTTIYLGRATGSGTGFAAVKIVRPVPSTDPVIDAKGATVKTYNVGENATAKINVSGKNLKGSVLTATFATTVEGLSVALDNNNIEDGSISAVATVTYTSSENADGTAELTFSDGETSMKVNIDYFALVNRAELVPISESTNWDFKGGITSGNVDFSEPEKNIEFVYSDLAKISGMTFADGFKAESLAFKGQYPKRVGKDFAQAGILHFITTVPGYIEVKFSDTGSGATTTAAPRYLVVNDVQTEFWASRPNNGTDNPYDEKKDVVATVFVPAGDVYIKGSGDLLYNYVKFTKAEAPAAPAVKVDDVDFSDKSIVLSGANKTIKLTAANEAHNVYYHFAAEADAPEAALLLAEAPQTTIEHEGKTFSLVPEEGIVLSQAGTLSYFVHDPESDLKSAVAEITVTGTGETSALEIIAADQETETIVYDLLGRRVQNPSNGIYIVNGKKVLVK